MKEKMLKNGNDSNSNRNNRNNRNNSNNDDDDDDDEREGEKEGEKEKCIVSMISKQVSNWVFYAQLTGAVISEDVSKYDNNRSDNSNNNIGNKKTKNTNNINNNALVRQGISVSGKHAAHTADQSAWTERSNVRVDFDSNDLCSFLCLCCVNSKPIATAAVRNSLSALSERESITTQDTIYL